MADSTFNVHGPALEACTRRVIHPHHITEIPGAQHVDHAVPQNFQPPPGEPAAAQAPPQLEVQSFPDDVLEQICDFDTYRDALRYLFPENPVDLPEADDETMEENTMVLKDQPSLQETLVEENTMIPEDQASPQETPVEDSNTMIPEDQANPQRMVPENPPSLQVTLVDTVKCQCGFSPAGDPNTPQEFEISYAASIECTYCKAGREASPIHMDVLVQTVSEEGSDSSRILMEINVDQTANSDSQAMKGEASSVELKSLEALANLDDQLIKCSMIVPEGEPPTTKINHALEEAASAHGSNYTGPHQGLICDSLCDFPASLTFPTES